MYADVKEQNSGDAQSLQARLRLSAAEAIRHRPEQSTQGGSYQRSSTSTGVDTLPSNSHNPGPTGATNNESPALSTTMSDSTSSTRQNDQGNGHNSTMHGPGLVDSSIRYRGSAVPNATLPSENVCNLLLCINQNSLPSVQPTCLEHVDLTGVTNDQYFFERIGAFYKNARKKSSWRFGNTTFSRWSLLSWMPKDWTLFVPSAALYVKVRALSPLSQPIKLERMQTCPND